MKRSNQETPRSLKYPLRKKRIEFMMREGVLTSMFDPAWEEKKYNEVFEFICKNVKRQQDSDPEFCFEHVRARLNDAYARQGNGWAGTDPIMDITESATIAAYEYILAEWRK